MSRNTPRFLLLALAALPVVAAADAPVCALGFGSSSYIPRRDESPTAEGVAVMQRITQALAQVCSPKCPNFGLFRNPTAPNALTFATLGAAKIVYSPAFLSAVKTRYGNDAATGIMSHAYGHMMDAVSIGSWMNFDWSAELRADAWAGCALAKLKLDSAPLKHAVTAMAQYPSAAQTNWTARISPLGLGYQRCGGNPAAFANAADAIKVDPKKKSGRL